MCRRRSLRRRRTRSNSRNKNSTPLQGRSRTARPALFAFIIRRGMNILITTLFLAVAVTAPADLTNPPASAEHLPDGLITMKLSDGTGTVHPASDDVLKVRYTMWRPDGKVVDQI